MVYKKKYVIVAIKLYILVRIIDYMQSVKNIEMM